MGKKAEALDSLRKAVEAGYSNVSWMKRDGDLKSLHDDPAFKEMAGKIERENRQAERPDDGTEEH
jgi:hypothetical protein